MANENNFNDIKTAEILARLDERTFAIQSNMKMMQEDVKSFKDDLNNIRIELKKQNENLNDKIQETHSDLNDKFNEMKTDIDNRFNEMESSIEKKYVSNDRYLPVEKIIYGLVTLILTAVGSGIIGYFFIIH